MSEPITDKQEPESKEVVNEEVKQVLPSLDEFSKLSTEEKEKLIINATKEQPSVPASEPSKEVSAEEKAEQPSGEPKVETPAPVTDKQDDDLKVMVDGLKTKLESNEKSYKELQAAFTKSRQELAEIKKSSESQPISADKVRSEVSRLKGLANGDKDTEKFLGELESAMLAMAQEQAEKIVSEKVKPIEKESVERLQNHNVSTFNSHVEEFVKSPLNALKAELNAIIGERFESNEALLEAAKQNPQIFTDFVRELHYRHPEKVVEIKGKAKPSATPTDPRDRNKEIQKTGISGKSKTSIPAEPSADDLQVFDKMSLEDKEKYLRSKGRIKF